MCLVKADNAITEGIDRGPSAAGVSAFIAQVTLYSAALSVVYCCAEA
jgi:hypothetical protein